MNTASAASLLLELRKRGLNVEVQKPLERWWLIEGVLGYWPDTCRYTMRQNPAAASDRGTLRGSAETIANDIERLVRS